MHYATVRSRRVNPKTWCCWSSHHRCQVEPNLPPPQTTPRQEKPRIQTTFLMENKSISSKDEGGFQHFRALVSVSTMQTKPVQQQLCFLLQKKSTPVPIFGLLLLFFFFFESLEIPLAVLQKTTKKIYLDKGKQQKKKTKQNFPAVREFLIFLSIFSIFHQGSGPWEEGQG